MKTTFNFFIICLLIAALSVSCKKKDDNEYKSAGPFANGAFISNEGTFGHNNGSVSYYDFAGDSVRNNIYSPVNKHNLGQLLQSVYIANGMAYMVMNVSDTVVVASVDDFKAAGYITGLNLPRYMTSYSNKGYITQWGENGAVKVVDLSLNKVIKTIKAGTGPEFAMVVGGNVMVCNGGGFDVDSTITVINPTNDNILQTIRVGDNPKEMVVDKNNNIWVICYGYIKYDLNYNIILETPSKLVKLSGEAPYQKLGEYIISQTKHPQHIDISNDKSTVYYGGGFGFTGIYAMNITAASLPASPFIGVTSFYGFNVIPSNGDIYALDAGDYTGPGTLSRYSKSGSLIKQYSTGIAPNGVAFN
ncbi:MAG: DUF5074 domain-containing protein [Bacteroidota bacterium]